MGINIKDFEVNYFNHKVIKSLSLHIPKKKVNIIIGPNGCGKSTLLKSIMRIIPYEKGEIFLNDKSMKSLSQKKVSKEIAFLPQSPIIPERIKVRELVAFGRFPYQKPMGSLSKEDYEIIDWAIEKTNIKDIKDKLVSELSGGQRQRAFISLALAQKTHTLILDEPTTYLDMSHQFEVLNLLRKLNREDATTIIMVIHELNLACKFADNIIGMKKGEVMFMGSPKDVITKDNLRSLYDIDATLINEKGYPVCTDYSMAYEKQ